jgi:predicted RNA-binding protein YlxR (DUF448 family)
MQSFPKKEIVRLVAVEGRLAIDLTGRLNGRGAYLCRTLDCFDAAMKKKRLMYALGVSMTPEACAGLREEDAKEISSAEVSE